MVVVVDLEVSRRLAGKIHQGQDQEGDCFSRWDTQSMCATAPGAAGPVRALVAGLDLALDLVAGLARALVQVAAVEAAQALALARRYVMDFASTGGMH